MKFLIGREKIPCQRQGSRQCQMRLGGGRVELDFSTILGDRVGDFSSGFFKRADLHVNAPHFGHGRKNRLVFAYGFRELVFRAVSVPEAVMCGN